VDAALRTAVVVDEYPLWLEAVAQVVARINVEAVRMTTSAVEARNALDEIRPDLLITEISVADGAPDGLDLIRYAREHNPELRAVVLSQYDDGEHVDAAFEAGAAAYVLKKADPDDLTAAIRQAFDKSIFLSSLPRPTAIRPVDISARSRLTHRQLEILTLVAEGYSNAEVARTLWVTEQTVKFHLANVYRKLDVANRTQASHWARAHGLFNDVAAHRLGRA
jgi:DNA-binding NarL/FixJ family response regulator